MEEILSYTCQVLENIQFLHFNEDISFRMRKEPSDGKIKRPRDTRRSESRNRYSLSIARTEENVSATSSQSWNMKK